MDTNCQRTHRTYRQRGGVYLKLFNLYLRFTNLPCLKLPICFTCKTYLENFQKHRQLILKKKNQTLYSDCTAWNFSLSTALFCPQKLWSPRQPFFFFLIYVPSRIAASSSVAWRHPKKKRLRGRLQNYSSEINNRKILHQIPTYL